MDRVEQHLLILDELEALAMDVTRHLHALLIAAPKYTHSIHVAFDRACLTVRRCILLSRWLQAGCPATRSGAAHPTPAEIDAPKAPRSEPTGNIRLERVEHVDFGADPESALQDGRFDAAVDALKRLLILEPGLDPTPEAIATRLVAAAAAGPPSDARKPRHPRARSD